MEVKDVVFTGIGRAMSDMDCQDGELSISHNIIRDNGAMRPIWIPGEGISLVEGEKIVYIHRNTGYKNYITLKDSILYWFDDSMGANRYVIKNAGEGEYEYLNLNSIGNTLIVSTDKGIYYALFEDGAYTYLGEKPDETVISFDLESSFLNTADGDDPYTYNVSSDKMEDGGEKITIKEEYQQYMGEVENGLVNRLLADARDSNRIVYPCFVRYAYKLYDGSYIMHSSPVLLVPNSDFAPVVCAKMKIDTNTGNAGVQSAEFSAMACASDIYYNVLENNGISKWSDIVKSVDIFMSEPISSRNTDAVKVTELVKLHKKGAGNGLIYANQLLYENDPLPFYSIASAEVIPAGERSVLYMMHDKSMDRADFHAKVKETSIFFKVRSIDIKDMDNGRRDLLITPDENNGSPLSTLAVGERMTDDYQTHDFFTAKSMYVYNHRLNLSGMTRKLFEGYNTSAMVFDIPINNSRTQKAVIYTYINKDGKEMVVKNECYGMEKFYPMYLFYPDADAYKMVINIEDKTNNGVPMYVYELKLEKHPYLNGAVFFDGFRTAKYESKEVAIETTDSTIELPNKIYTSEVDNPFFFPLSGINTVGTGRVKGMASATKALSQGQFGQFPLYVFSTDGVWAMEVGDTGLYSSQKPISRDVCINGDSITQTDNSVLFVSEKGVMAIDGGTVQSISDMMNGRSLDTAETARLGDVMTKEGFATELAAVHDFMDYAREGRMVYDYTNGRIILYSEGKGMCYVFSLSGGTWATMDGGIDAAVNDYPDAYIQQGLKVTNVSQRIDYDNKEKIRTLIVTRPVKLGDDGYKTVYEMVSRGAMDRRSGAVMIWGSHDGLEYVLIADAMGNRLYRNGGTGYRYYRIGIVGEMNVGETVTMCSLKFRRKYNNRLR